MRKPTKGIVRDGKLFNSEVEADACSNRRRKHGPSRTTITLQGVSITQKNVMPDRKSRKLRRALRKRLPGVDYG